MWILKQLSGGIVVAKAKVVATIDPGVTYDALLSFDGHNFNLTFNGASVANMQAAGVPFDKVGFKAKKTSGTFGHIEFIEALVPKYSQIFQVNLIELSEP